MPGGPHRNRSHPDDPAFERTRAKIQTTQLVKRLENHGLGTDDDQGNEVKLETSQVTAIKVLLDKTIPNLQAVTLSAPDGGPVQYANLTEEELDARIEEALKEADLVKRQAEREARFGTEYRSTPIKVMECSVCGGGGYVFIPGQGSIKCVGCNPAQQKHMT